MEEDENFFYEPNHNKIILVAKGKKHYWLYSRISRDKLNVSYRGDTPDISFNIFEQVFFITKKRAQKLMANDKLIPFSLMDLR